MPTICPTITATSAEEYRTEVEKVAHFAHRLQIDLTDGVFAEHKTIGPADAWWPAGVMADFHLMYQDPFAAAAEIIRHKPHLIIVHAEAHGDFSKVRDLCKEHKVKVGVALLPDTPVGRIASVIPELDHVLIFSGNLGYQGGSQANLSLLEKVKTLRASNPDLEIGWDGGVNTQNVSQLVFGGIDVLNVGGFIQSDPNPEQAFLSLQRIADETGTT